MSRADVLTTLQLPLGQWVTIASSGEHAQARERGVASTRESSSDRRVVVQMRVTAP